MRVLVFEFVTGGGFAGQAMIPSLTAEGDMMLAAAVADLSRMDGIQVLISRDARLALPSLPVEVRWVHGDWAAAWAESLKQVDAVLPIAPETAGILEGLCRSVLASGRLLLGCRPEAVALAASKLATAERLRAHGIPVVETWRGDRLPAHLPAGALVAKPDTGVGCMQARILPGPEALREFLRGRPHPAQWVAQPYREGLPASLSVLVHGERVRLLACNVQRVVQVDQGFVLLGCVINGIRAGRDRLESLAAQVCRAVPGLWGYVGIDLLQTRDGPEVLEVNPRLTTAYVGLSRSVGHNIAEWMLALARGLEPEDWPATQGRRVDVDLECCHVA